jgi:putative hydrolase of the HAD superfamily
MQFNTVIFDLDDTLYQELTFVKSGFKVVAEYLEKINPLNESKELVLAFMLNSLKTEGRGMVFNDVLTWLNLEVDQHLSTLIYLYRNHIPSSIELNLEMKILIKELISNNIKLGIITDGIYVTQKNKTDVLLHDIPCSCIIHTDTLGQQGWKPSFEPFKIAMNLLNTHPNDSVYVGDNPVKDFKGARSIKMKTIWWNPENRNYDFLDTISTPDYRVHNINDLYKILLN